MSKCKKWEKGENCEWNQRTARIVLLPFLFLILGYSIYLAKKLRARNNGSLVARPVLCVVCVALSQTADIIDHFLSLSEMREGGHDWYQNNTVDGLGDIFLMYSLYLFAQIWCDNVHVLASKYADAESFGSMYLNSDLNLIRSVYRIIAIATLPLAILFSNGGLLHRYDFFLLMYVGWGVFTGILILTPVAFLMYRTITMLPPSCRQESLYKQLARMARINLYEQLVWNSLIVVTFISIMMFLQGDNKNGAWIGTASIAISVAWMVMHGQILLFFSTVSHASSDSSSSIYEESLLHYSLLQGETESSANTHDAGLTEV